jgi:hypothetical protein
MSESSAEVAERDEAAPAPRATPKTDPAVRQVSRGAFPGWLPGTVLAAVLVVGIALRIREYFFNRSLWLDEGMLAHNLLTKGYRDLVGPVGDQQGAPLGWLWAERTSINLFGTSELSLRLLPFLSSIGLVLVFPVLARRLLKPWAVVAASLLLAVSPQLIRYASELKQYETEALVTVLLLLLLTAPRAWSGLRRAAVTGLAAGLLCWFSFPAVFLVVAMLPLLAIQRLRHRRPALPVLIAGAIVAASLGLEYLASLRYLAKDDGLHAFWVSKGGFPPGDEGASGYLTWLVGQPGHVLSDPGKFSYPVAGMLIVIWGALMLGRKRPPAPAVLLLLAAPLAGLAIAAIGKYPFVARLSLWVLPLVFILLAAVLQLPRPAVFVSALLLFAVSYSALAAGIGIFRSPTQVTDARSTYAFVSQNWRPGDVLITEAIWTNPTYLYYAPRYHLIRSAVFSLKSRPSCPEPNLLTSHRSGRIWVVLDHHPGGQPGNRTAIYLSQFEQYGVVRSSFHGAGDSGAYLLETSSAPKERSAPLQGWVPQACLALSPPPS